jgi:hypothetical protein
VLGRGDHDDLRAGEPGEDLAGGADAVGARHQQVHEDDVGLVVERELDRLAAAPRLRDHDDAGTLKHVPENSPDEGIVIRDDHGQRRVVQSIATVHRQARSGRIPRSRRPATKDTELGTSDQRTG